MHTKLAILACLSLISYAGSAAADEPPATTAPEEASVPPAPIARSETATIVEPGSNAASAQVPQLDRPEMQPSAQPERRGAHLHDGFYLRFATGLAVYEQSLRSEDTTLYGGGTVDARTSGVANTSALAIGGTVARGLVIGGGVFTSTLLASDTRIEEGKTLPSDIDPKFGTLSVVGPFFDYYFRPDRGLHIEGGLGLAVLSGYGSTALNQDNEDHHDAIGGGLIAGFGHEWWVADEWSVGILGRVLMAVTTAEDDQNVRWVQFVSSTPGVLFTGTYH